MALEGAHILASSDLLLAVRGVAVVGVVEEGGGVVELEAGGPRPTEADRHHHHHRSSLVTMKGRTE